MNLTCKTCNGNAYEIGVTGHHYVECAQCGTQTHVFRTPTAAVTAWRGGLVGNGRDGLIGG